ncbi:hypothetical protein COV93_00450 [Candidatus Woesearchaeota archaeon CG11_big_fil_rev_8_21_14_0_20_43_8]|nr:MAG: hypothetical protein COV93_00450 [Candidatus Woesearchaeota archaeon CG11_big_fil_rev_8_21_14_0_20_43_8]PIO06915.1 MAG: hypothetical protein COT47_02240 [Candidatus Woesearchaeota archaeon CG08_land_8_20_14_0_20_43_7]
MPEENKQRKLNFNITDGSLFFADEVAVIHNLAKLFVDFKNTSPRVDIRYNEFQPMVLEHNVIMMDLWTAKQLHKSLGENIGNYEKSFGKIKMPEPIKKSEKMAKDAQKIACKPKPVKTISPPSYFG